jgi:FTR1 family protein
VVGSLLIFAREGLEGTLICSILLACLAAAGRRDLFRYVFAGGALAVALATGTGVVLWIVSRDTFVHSNQQAWFETGVFAVAVGVLTYMTFWMRRHSRSMGRELRSRVSGAVTGGSGIALGAIAFVTVGREAVETVIFLIAIAYQSSPQSAPLQLGIGAVIGLGVALGLSFAMYRVGVRVNLGRFFAVVGSLLMVVAAAHERDPSGQHRDRRRPPWPRRVQRGADAPPGGALGRLPRRGADPVSAPGAAIRAAPAGFRRGCLTTSAFLQDRACTIGTRFVRVLAVTH